jgi:hypothetical protein
MTFIIGLTGNAEHGKNAAANIILEWVAKQGGTAAIFEISGMILAECIELGLLPPGSVRNQQDKEQNRILMEHGSNRRAENPDYWVNGKGGVVPAMRDSGLDVAVCPNVRFQTEGDGIRAEGGTIWLIQRLNRDGSKFVSKTRDQNHVTETVIGTWPADFYLYNMEGHGALLEEQVVTLFEYAIELRSYQHGLSTLPGRK